MPQNFTYNPLSIYHYYNLLDSKVPFSLSRFGNGEFDSILNRRNITDSNASKHNYFPEIGKRLKNVIIRHGQQRGQHKYLNYYLSIAQRFFRPEHSDYSLYGPLLSKFHNDHNLDISYTNCDIFANASRTNKLVDFVDILNDKYNDSLIFVGPEFFKDLKTNNYLFKDFHHVVSPLINCYLEYDRVKQEIIDILEDSNNINKHFFVSISFSLSAGILVDELYQLYGDKHTFIDIGSLWDPYCNVHSRKYHKKLKTPLLYNQPKIDIRIPFEPNGKLGFDYNRIMNETEHEWVLFLDHDVIVSLHPNWYHICQEVICNNPDAGLFTCYASDIGCPLQKLPDQPLNNLSILEHKEYAKELWDKNKYSTRRIQDNFNLLSGFFLLVSKSAYLKTSGFDSKAMYTVDNHFHQELNRKNIPIYLIEGLYCYHLRDRSKIKFIEDQQISTDFIKRDCIKKLNNPNNPNNPNSVRLLRNNTRIIRKPGNEI